MPMTEKIAIRLDKINGCSLVRIPKSNPISAGAMPALSPSDTVGVTRQANTIIQLIPPIGLGKRLVTLYHAHSAINVPPM